MRELFSTQSKARSIEVKDDIIIYTRKCDGVADYVTYNETIYQILTMNRLRPFRNNGRLKFNIRANGEDSTYYLYDLVLAIERGFVTGIDDLLPGMQRYYDDKGMNAYDVDHVDNNIHNNTILNVSLMRDGVNKSKSTLVAKFKPPYILNAVYCGGEYRIQLKTDISKQTISRIEKAIRDIGLPIHINRKTAADSQMLFICPTGEDFRDCLKMLVDTHYGWSNIERTPRQYHKVNENTPYWAGDIRNSLKAQRELNMMERTKFMTYQDGAPLPQ